MCTLTYLPLSEGNFLLTSNRDESPLRAPARTPEFRDIAGQKLVFPVDGKAGGTWIAAAESRRTVCLLNGAFAPHQMGGTYRLSRGVVVLESFAYDRLADFATAYDFAGIEPFTFVGFELGVNGFEIVELRWDGKELHTQAFPADEPHIWSSAQLYKPEVIAQRKVWFSQWLGMHPNYNLADIQGFHQFGGEGDIYNDIRMNRNNLVKTVSTTAIENLSEEIRMHYTDLLHEGTVTVSMPI